MDSTHIHVTCKFAWSYGKYCKSEVTEGTVEVRFNSQCRNALWMRCAMCSQLDLKPFKNQLQSFSIFEVLEKVVAR